MRLRVDHETRYSYDAPVAYGLQQVRLRPKDTRGQKVLDWEIKIEGGESQLRYEDHNGNAVDLIGIEPGRTETAIRCVGLIENSESDGVLGAHRGFLPLWHFRRSSDLTKAGEGVRIGLRAVKKIDHATLEGGSEPSPQPAQIGSNRELVDPQGASHAVPVIAVEGQQPGAEGQGPAVLEEAFWTCSVPADWHYRFTGNGDIFLKSNKGQ